jgi:hypothetical protein
MIISLNIINWLVYVNEKCVLCDVGIAFLNII